MKINPSVDVGLRVVGVALGVAAFVFSSAAQARGQEVTKPTVPGITNFSKLETTVACAGATKPEAVPAIKEMGYKSIISLRVESEPGADIEAEAAAAKQAGIEFIHIPFVAASPSPAAADAFVEAITKSDNTPAFIHCASANRAAAMWMIKRMVVDKWDAERAGQEAAALGLTNGQLKTFAVDYAAAHQR
jgi:uncharacterized protein (TIGR01244 family)